MQHWLVKEYAKLVGNHLQIWSGSFTGRGGGGGLGLLKLQLQVLKKRRVLIIYKDCLTAFMPLLRALCAKRRYFLCITPSKVG